MVRLVALLTFLAFGAHVVHSCTTFAAGKKATADGSVIVSQSSDGAPDQDARLAYVPAADHAAGSQRPIYYGNELFPRFFSKDFGPDYFPLNGEDVTKPIGSIPQVSHTFGYRDMSYGVINEQNVGIGETTCSAMFQTCGKGTSIGCEDGRTVGEALFSIDSLTKIAMERASTAREAVQLMGDLAVKYGFYGTQDPNGHGEALQVGDADEAFSFNILADPTGTSAIWAAIRVPDENFTVMSNMFTIREVDVNDTFNCLASPNVYSVAQKLGWWKPGEILDFTKVYSNGEYLHQYYAGRRMWGAFRLVAPSQKLPSEYTNLRYDRMWPWSMKPDKLLTVQDIFALYRDWYGDTPFDMTKGVAAGPFGTPDRFGLTEGIDGSWERSIAIYRSNDIHVQQLRKPSDTLPKELAGISWYAQGAAHYSAFIPIPSGLTTPIAPLLTAVPTQYDPKSMNWANRRIGSVCQIRFDKMHPLVEAKQSALENLGQTLVDGAAAYYAQSGTTQLDVLFASHADTVLKEWHALFDELLYSYGDNTDMHAKGMPQMGYPSDWLKAAGYPGGPPPPPAMDQCPPKCPGAAIVV